VISLIALYLLLVIALPLALSAAVSYRTLPEGVDCPLCRGETLRLSSRWLAIASMLAPKRALQRRWCLGCGWDGAARVPPPVSLRPLDRIRMWLAARRRTQQKTVELRALEVDGRSWRVLLQCWRDAKGWRGRLLFLEPTGRMWADATGAIRGRTRFEVLGQARSLPEPILSVRLRSTTSR
jgi:hypothetical protein